MDEPDLGFIPKWVHDCVTMRSINHADYERGIRGLVEARKEAGLSQRELARRIQQPQSFVSKYERNERRLDFAEFHLICGILGIDSLEFWSEHAC